MIAPEVEAICKDIKALRVQGARKVAIAAVRAMAVQAKASEARTQTEFYADILEAADALAGTRPTEPMLRNYLTDTIRFLLFKMKSQKAAPVSKLKAMVAKLEKTSLAEMDANVSKIAEFGAKEIPKGATVLTHCHSNTVMAILKRSHELGKGISVICTETRPLFQGRRTAKELSEAGLPVTMIVDSAVESFIDKAGLVIVGADAVTSSGDLFNKIGTAGIARIAYDHDIKFYSAAELHKYDPLTRWGIMEKIEERDAGEVADTKEFRGVKIRNPAFDVTAAKFISAYITEMGVLAPQGLAALAAREFEKG
jgi:ribose 1,5-bisphosphate isomerase